MHFRQLEIFLAVARLSSFSKAAEELHLAQPTVSSHVHALESELNAQLFIRSTKGLRLTLQGQTLYPYASQIVAFTGRAKAELSELKEAQQNRLTVAASTVPAQYLLPAVLPRASARCPKTCFCVRQGDSAEALQLLQDGEAEVAVTGAREELPHLVYYPLLTEHLVAAAPDTPYFRSLKGVLPADVLQNFAFILREQGSGTRKSTETLLKNLSIRRDRMHIAAELPSTESVLRSVSAGLGISIVSRLAAEYFLHPGGILLFDFDDPAAKRHFYAAVRKDLPLSPAARCLTEELRRFRPGESSEPPG